MASPWHDYDENAFKAGKPLPTEPPPSVRDDPQGYSNYYKVQAAQEEQKTQAQATQGGGTSTSTNTSQQQNNPTFAPYVPPPREAYGPYLGGDIAARTIGLDQKTRVDPYTATRFTIGNDGTWRESGTVSRSELSDVLARGAMPPVGQDVRNQTMAGPQLGANPMLRPGAGTAGMANTLGPTEAPSFSSFQGFQVPGLGFNAEQYRPGPTNIDLNSVRLPTQVATRPYGFDFGGVPAGTGGRSTGPAAVNIDMPRYSVPNNYMGGPSGFAGTDANFSVIFAFTKGWEDRGT